MTREPYIPHEDDSWDPDIASVIRTYVDPTQASPLFAAGVRARVAQHQHRSALSRLWVPVLATSLLLSLALNIYGFMERQNLLTNQQPNEQPSVTVTVTSHNAETVVDLTAELQAGNYAKLFEVADLVLTLKSDIPQAYRYRGLARARLGENKQADDDLRHVTSLGDMEAGPAWMAHNIQRFQ
ncbi:MAG: hypothetical protein ETSY2_45115 [Candidatus Entotheonella gemina]|uniref:Uncharacterized protein n=1 Tax=Candidatus Entotheonella gemina TaxID=1429439 RepID=W4LGM3_9BACT|nr:MAG: hypothetical protein ETSY2_45115 [Candidatus Entotheonella gemina]